LSPQQICGIDKGQYKLGAILDLAALFRESSGEDEVDEGEIEQIHESLIAPPVYSESGQSAAAVKDDLYYDEDSLAFFSGALGEIPHDQLSFIKKTEAPINRRKLQSKLRLVKPRKQVEQPDSKQQTKLLDMRLGDIADRLKRLEKLLGSI
jgi:hypothetical protein